MPFTTAPDHEPHPMGDPTGPPPALPPSPPYASPLGAPPPAVPGPPPVPPVPPVSRGGAAGVGPPGVSLWAAAVFAFLVTLVVASLVLGTGHRLLSAGSTRLGLDDTAGAPPAPRSAPTTWSEVAAAVNPGVVDIDSRLPNGIGSGTGMVLTSDGEILTNSHVVDGATQIVVTVTATGRAYGADIVGQDRTRDVAVLQLTRASGLATIPLGTSEGVRVGDAVAAIGNAGGQGGDPVLAAGTVVALHQQITASDPNGSNAEVLLDMIQADAQVVPGDSGGPLVDTDAEVIGMTTATLGAQSRFQTGAPQSFAIPIDTALGIAKELESGGSAGSGGSASPGGSGGSGTQQSPGAGYLGVQVEAGVDGGALVTGVVAGSPADQAGVIAGDVLIGLDGHGLVSPDDLISRLASHAGGDSIVIDWQDRNGQIHEATVTLAAR